MNQQTIDMLTDMKLSAMAAEFAAQLKDSSFNALSFEERFSMAVTAEWNKRQTNKVNRLIKKAHLGLRPPRRKVLNITKTASWTNPRCYGYLPANTLTRDTM